MGKLGLIFCNRFQCHSCVIFLICCNLEDYKLDRADEPSTNSFRAIKSGNSLSTKTIQSSGTHYCIQIGSVCYERALKEIIWFPDIKTTNLRVFMIAELISFGVFQHFGMPMTWGCIINTVIKEPGLMKFDLLETPNEKQSIQLLVFAFLSSKGVLESGLVAHTRKRILLPH